MPLPAQATEHLGFGVTCALTYEHPYPFARRMSTLDHLSQGRIGWNIVTSYLDSAARNMGLAQQIGHDGRYEMAEEYLQVCYKLWEGSWEDDAVVRDKQRRIFTDPTKIHGIAHAGEFYTVPGIHSRLERHAIHTIDAHYRQLLEARLIGGADRFDVGILGDGGRIPDQQHARWLMTDHTVRSAPLATAHEFGQTLGKAWRDFFVDKLLPFLVSERLTIGMRRTE